jgi:hypothetical protein
VLMAFLDSVESRDLRSSIASTLIAERRPKR